MIFLLLLFYLPQLLSLFPSQPPITIPDPTPTSTPAPSPSPRSELKIPITTDGAKTLSERSESKGSPNSIISELSLWTGLATYRSSHNRPSLILEESLCRYARKRVQQHSGRTDLDNHAGFQADADSGSLFTDIGGDFINIAEVLAYLPSALTATQVIEWGWDSSPAHREGILANEMTHACFTGIAPFYVGILGHR